MGQEFLNAEEKKVIQVDRVNTLLQAFNMMMLGRVKMVPSDMEVGYVLLQQNMDKKTLNEITHSEHLIQMTDYHLTLPKAATKSAELIKKFNRGLAALRKSGRYQKIVKEFYQKKIYKDSVPEKFLTVTTH